MNTFSLQTRLYSGQGSLAVLKRFTNKHIWIICDGFLARSPIPVTTVSSVKPLGGLPLPDGTRLNPAGVATAPKAAAAA